MLSVCLFSRSFKVLRFSFLFGGVEKHTIIFIFVYICSN